MSGCAAFVRIALSASASARKYEQAPLRRAAPNLKWLIGVVFWSGHRGPSAAPLLEKKNGREKKGARQTKQTRKENGSPGRECGRVSSPAVAAHFANIQNSNPGLLTAYAAAANNNNLKDMTLPEGGFPDRRVRADSSDEVDKANAEGIKSAFKLAGGVLIFAVVWMVLGVAAFVMSLVCLSKNGSKSGENVIGLLLALLLGPFYWFYYIWGGSYCTNRIAPSAGLEAAKRARWRPGAGPFFSRSP